MDDDQTPPQQPTGERAHVGPPDLILQAIVPPTDTPVEIRAAVASALAKRDAPGERAYAWEDVTFAASVIALVEGTNQRDQPDMQWVFALNADSPKLGEQVRSLSGWSCSVGSEAFADGSSRTLWRASVHESLTTAPRPWPETPAA